MSNVVAFISSLIGFIITGVTFTAIAFSYMGETYASRAALEAESLRVDSKLERLDRIEYRFQNDVKLIHKKLDRILEKL